MSFDTKLLLVLLIIVLVIAGPFITIWSLINLTLMIRDALNSTGDPYTWQNWLSIIIIGSLFKTTVKTKE